MKKTLVVVVLMVGLLVGLPAGTALAYSAKLPAQVSDVTATQTFNAETGLYDVTVTIAWDTSAGKPYTLESYVQWGASRFEHLKLNLTAADLKKGAYVWSFTSPEPCVTCQVWLFNRKGVQQDYTGLLYPF